MNTTLANDTRHPVQQAHPQQSRRVGIVDRAALHLGVALIKWGRRPALGSYERRANRLERALADARREVHVTVHRDAARLEYAQIARMR